MSRIDFEPPVALLSAAEETPGEAPDERPIIERESFRAQLAAWWASTLRVREQIWVVLGPVWRAIKLVARSITGLGWTTLFVGILAWVAAWAFGWVEAVYAAIFCLVALCLGALFTIGRTNIEVTMALTPQRIRVGQSSVASFQVTNLAHRRIGSLSVRLPVGETAARFVPPTLHRGETHEDWVSIPATKRGVIPIGPIYTDRDDPFGLVRRELRWTDVTELFVHPEIVALDTLGSGILRDLEGQSTPNVSSADLAFHALRDYVTGDDMRHIHWKSSARLSSITGDDRFMVRQFLDTRRTHIGLLSDLNASHYADDDEFEVALSCAASIVARALMDDMDITIICGKEVVERPKSRYALDCFSRAEPGRQRLIREFERVYQQAGDASLAIMVTGAKTGFEDLQRGRIMIPYHIKLLVVRVVLGEEIRMRQTAGFVELTIGTLEDLPRALRGGLI